MNDKDRFNAFYSYVIDCPRRVILFAVFAISAFGYFLQFVAPSMSYKDLFGPEFPLLVQYERLQSEYTNDESLLVFIEAKEGDAFTPRILQGVETLTKDLWHTPYSTRVDSITNHQHTQAVGDELRVGDLFEQSSNMDSEEIARRKEIAITDPLTLNRVVNPEGNAFSVVVSFALPNLGLGEKPEIMKFVNVRAETFRKAFPEVNVYVGGLVALDATFLKLSTEESALFLILNTMLVVVLMAVLLRRLKPLLFSIFIFIFSIVAAMALSGLMGWKITPFTASVPTVVLIIAVADCVHIITAFSRHLDQGIDQRRALFEALSANGRPIVITSLTTAAGLLTLNFSESLSVAALGTMSALGVMTACVLSLTLLPALLAVSKHAPRNKLPLITDEQFVCVANVLYRRRREIVIFILVLACFLSFGLVKNEYNEYFPTTVSQDQMWRQANDFGEVHFGGAYNFSFSVESGTPGSVADPQFLESVEQLTLWLRSLPEVAYAKSITDTLKTLNRDLHAGDEQYYRLPESREQASQYLLLYETSLPYGLELTDRVNLDKSATKVFAAFISMSSGDIILLEERLNEWLDEYMADYEVTWSGVQLMSSHLLAADGRGLTRGAFFGLLVISFFLVVLLGSLRVGLLSIFPNILPAVFGFGVWGYLVGEIGMGVSVAAGITLGIIVDDTVHFLTKYLNGREHYGMNPTQASAYALQQVGPAIVFTTIVLVAGFLLISVVTNLGFNADMGLMTAVVLVLAMLFTLLGLPALLMIFDRKTPGQESA